MKYIVMECHPAYVIVLDENGLFKKAANLNYETGQTLTDIIELQIEETNSNDNHTSLHKRQKRLLHRFISMAACLCIIILGSWHFAFQSYGSVRMRINPDIEISVNRLNYVIKLEGLNEDGHNLIKEYQYIFKDLTQVSEELTDLASDMGYLKDGGTISLTVTSGPEQWRQAIEDTLIIELDIYTGPEITVTEKFEEEIIIVPYDNDDNDDNDDKDNDNDDIDDVPVSSNVSKKQPITNDDDDDDDRIQNQNDDDDDDRSQNQNDDGDDNSSQNQNDDNDDNSSQNQNDDDNDSSQNQNDDD